MGPLFSSRIKLDRSCARYIANAFNSRIPKIINMKPERNSFGMQDKQ